MGKLTQHSFRAAIPVAIITAGRWLRHHQLDKQDLLTGGVVFLVLIGFSYWLSSAKKWARQ